MNLLHTIGLMTRAEHERLCVDRFESLEGMIDSRNETIETITADRDNWRAIARDRLLMVNNLSAGAEEWQAKFKQAVADLEKQAVKIEVLEDAILQAEAQADALRPDAESMRKKRAADRKRMAGKRGKGQ